MYHALIRGRLRGIFMGLNQGDYLPTVNGMADRFEHRFAGHHPLGGVRHTWLASVPPELGATTKARPMPSPEETGVALAAAPWFGPSDGTFYCQVGMCSSV